MLPLQLTQSSLLHSLTKTSPPKKKGNPIITRYPPPPGYRGPAQPQRPFGSNHFQGSQQNFPQGPATYPSHSYQGPPTPSYSPQGFGQPQSFPAQQTYSQGNYQQPQHYSWTQQAGSSHTPQSYAPQVPHTTQGQTGYRAFPTQPFPINTNQQTWPPLKGWQQTPISGIFPSPNKSDAFGGHSNEQASSGLNALPTPSSATPTNTQPPSTTSDSISEEKSALYLGWDDWDFDFDGAIWPKANEPVDPNLSLGVIVWRPAKQMTRALPATFDEAEEQSLKPPAEQLGNGESVSLYFTVDNSYEAFLDVRRTDQWESIKDDPAFVVFSEEEKTRNFVTIQDCLAMRDRPDEPLELRTEKDDEEMQDVTWNIMDHLEQALSSNLEEGKTSTQPNASGPPLRDQAQEDILAKLGVTGSPKPVSENALTISSARDQLPPSLPPKPPAPPPANMPSRPGAIPQRAQSFSGHHSLSSATATSRPYGSLSSANTQQLPSAQLERGDGSIARKRSYEDADQGNSDGRQSDDQSKRKRRSQVDAAYR